MGNLSGGFPPYHTIFDYYNQWRKNNVWHQMNEALREQARKAEGREATPSAVILNSQSIKTTEKGQRGFDTTKLVKGRKRFVLVDTLGLVFKMLVTEANVPERDGAEWLLTVRTLSSASLKSAN